MGELIRGLENLERSRKGNGFWYFLRRAKSDKPCSPSQGVSRFCKPRISPLKRQLHTNPIKSFCRFAAVSLPGRHTPCAFLPLRGLFFGGFAAFRLPAATNRRLRSAGGDSFRLAAVSLPGRQTIYAFVNSAASPRMVKARRSLNTNALILEILPFGSERPVPKVTVFPMSGSA